MTQWVTVELQDVVVPGSPGLKRGPFGGAIKKDMFVPKGYKIYEQKHAIYGDFQAGTYYINETKFQELKGFSVQADDLLVSCSGTMGRISIVPTSAHPGIINQALLRIRPDHQKVLPVFLKRLLETPRVQENLFGSMSGSAIKNVKPLGEIRSFKISLPPIAEQKRIAAILDKAEELRELRRQALRELDAIAQSIFIEMFGDPVKNPKNWKAVKLSDISIKITDGEHQTPKRTTQGIKLLSARNIQDGYIDVQNVDYIGIDEYERIRKRCDPVRGDILISCSGTIGRVTSCEIDEPISLVRSVALVRPDSKLINNKFLEYFLRTPALRAKMQQRANASSQANLFQNQIRELPAFLPPLALQKEFTKQMEALALLKTNHHESLAQLDALFASLQHRAFRGEL